MRPLSVAFACVLYLLCGSPAHAYWQAAGTGTGTAVSDTLPAGEQPAAAVAGSAVSVSWTQSPFQGQPIGTFGGGGYVVQRRPAAGGAAVTPNGNCDTTISGSATTLSCQELVVPAGSWTYIVTPVLMTWTGDPSPASAAVTVIAAPAQDAVSPQNPSTGQSTGDLRVSWSAVGGASGYNVYRRTASGSYDYATPLNGATPVATTTYTDPGAGLSAATTYAYVVRAVHGTPAAETADSNERSATPVVRPDAPTGVTATAVAAADVSVAWSAVAGATGYNVYRRTGAGAYDYATPLNGATPVADTSHLDTTAVDGTTYRYAVRAVITGAGGTPVESFTGTESAAVVADSTATPQPTSMTVNDGAGPLLATATCSAAANTRFINFAGRAAVPLTVVIPTPEPGETIRLSASTPGSTAVTATVAATGTSVSATMDLSSLLDGTVTITARTADAAGNLSATRAPTTATVKDIAAALSGLGYIDNSKSTADLLTGSSECGARITAVQTTGPSPGSTYPTSGTFTVGSGGTFGNFAVAAIFGKGNGVPYAYDVTATDLAANSSTVAIAGVSQN